MRAGSRAAAPRTGGCGTAPWPPLWHRRSSAPGTVRRAPGAGSATGSEQRQRARCRAPGATARVLRTPPGHLAVPPPCPVLVLTPRPSFPVRARSPVTVLSPCFCPCPVFLPIFVPALVTPPPAPRAEPLCALPSCPPKCPLGAAMRGDLLQATGTMPKALAGCEAALGWHSSLPWGKGWELGEGTATPQGSHMGTPSVAVAPFWGRLCFVTAAVGAWHRLLPAHELSLLRRCPGHAPSGRPGAATGFGGAGQGTALPAAGPGPTADH